MATHLAPALFAEDEDEVTIPELPGGDGATSSSAGWPGAADLAAALAAIPEDLKPEALRAQAITLVRQALERGRAEVREAFDEHRASGTETVIASGLNGGESVVIDGQLLLSDGVSVTTRGGKSAGS